MKDFNSVVKEIFRITNKVERKTMQELALKTSEECGELAQAVLSVTGAAGCGYKNKTFDDVDEEAVDTIICAFATAFKHSKNPNRLMKVFEKKMTKWKEKLAP